MKLGRLQQRPAMNLLRRPFSSSVRAVVVTSGPFKGRRYIGLPGGGLGRRLADASSEELEAAVVAERERQQKKEEET